MDLSYGILAADRNEMLLHPIVLTVFYTLSDLGFVPMTLAAYSHHLPFIHRGIL